MREVAVERQRAATRPPAQGPEERTWRCKKWAAERQRVAARPPAQGLEERTWRCEKWAAERQRVAARLPAKGLEERKLGSRGTTGSGVGACVCGEWG